MKQQIVIVLGLLTTLTIELLQRYVFYRIFDMDDIILNIIGVVIGYFTYLLAKLIITKKKHQGVNHNASNK
ncbi:VanZ family protein [Paenibacillus sp. CECT 9249]|uniref:VanZ family protein n=1 Tax=unclassified Paenibacillus TaxID=185978 RepID=UPI001C12343B|nr:VanZ family protein [Paenibacillus sp. MSJ-34]